jgi:UDP-N-acetylmuramoylalanine--D-glutamate ligase
MDNVVSQEKGATELGVRALIVGLAREGTALARFLSERGVQVTITDAKPAEALASNVEALAGLPITFVLGSHPSLLLDGADIVLVSPGVPLEIPLLAKARRRGLPLSSETRLFTRICPAPILGITGSSGKTTTSALVGEMLRAAGRRTWVGGNIGWPLISHLEEIAPADVVVMELSSFQLEFFAPWTGIPAVGEPESTEPGHPDSELAALFDSAGWSPPIAAILNITPNHLDRHPSMAAYVAAKANILAHQHPADVAVLNLDNPVTREIGQHRRAAAGMGNTLWFSMEQEVQAGAFLRGDELILRRGDAEEAICRTGDLQLLGEHNVANALAACALAGAAGAPVEAMRDAATRFGGVEHRLELIRERNGVRWYNDSIATTPERTVAALRSFCAPIVLLAGGRDKHLPWDEMAALTWQQVHHLILFGEAAGLIEAAMETARPTQNLTAMRGRSAATSTGPETEIHHAGTLEGAVELAARLAAPGEVVLLSPGGTSFDAYRDFTARGEHFRQLVNELE